jgi:hypothetical protein
VQAGIDMTNSLVHYSRPKTTATHISNSYSITSTTHIKAYAILENFKSGSHDCVCTLRKNGGGGYISAGSYVDVELDPPADARDTNHKRIKRTWDWNNTQLGGSVTSLELKLVLTTNSALDTFHVAERIHLAF